jgi:hypothetical protein
MNLKASMDPELMKDMMRSMADPEVMAEARPSQLLQVALIICFQ